MPIHYSPKVDPTLDTDFVPLGRSKPLANTDNLLFRGMGIKGVGAKATDVDTPVTTNIDWQVPEDRLINGTHVMLKNHDFEDSATLQVVDKDNVLGYGAGLVLNEFATNWNFVSDQESQGIFILPYPAKLLTGLYVRLKYTAHGIVDDVKVKVNFIVHKKQ